MAFSSAITQRPFVMGNKRVAVGTFTQAGGDTGGDINTGLRSCEFIMLQPTGAAVSADECAVNETLPVAGSAVTIVTTAGTVGNWLAMGY
jgi:hypothetical protein